MNTESINNNIRVIEAHLILGNITQNIIQNDYKNHNSYIVIHKDCTAEYIDCLLLNINIFDYVDVFKDFSTRYLKEFDLFHHNGFLGIEYLEIQMNKNNIINFFERHGNCFRENLKERVIQLHDEIIKEIKRRNDLGELFHIE